MGILLSNGIKMDMLGRGGEMGTTKPTEIGLTGMKVHKNSIALRHSGIKVSIVTSIARL